jgi:NADH-quinone oxidoreductase subunit M
VITLDLPLLALSVLLPLVGGLSVARLDHRDRARAWSVATALATLLVAMTAARRAYRGVEHGLVVDPLSFGGSGGELSLLGIDGLSAALIVFDAVVTLAILIAAPRGQLDARAAASILGTEAMTILAFCALDTWLLLLAWTASLVPGFLELRRAARPADARATSRIFAVYLFGSAVGLAVGVGLLTHLATGAGVATPMHMPALAKADLRASGVVILALAIPVLMRAGLVPFHSWIPAVFERVPPLVLLPTLLSQLGAYVLVRLVLLPFPGVLHASTPSVADAALVTAVYGAFLGLAQRDLRRAIGCLVMSQSALVFVGLECDNVEGVAGGLVLWITIGTAMTGLVLAVAAVHARVGPRKLDRFTGLAARAPWLAALFLILGLANVWLPGTLGFVGEDLLVHGVLATFPGVGIAIIVASAVNGFNVLRAFTYVFLGPAPPDLPAVGQLLPRERLALVGIVVLLVLPGLVPGPIVALRGQAAVNIVRRPQAPDDPPGDDAPRE